MIQDGNYTNYYDYLFTTHLSLNSSLIYDSCKKMDQIIHTWLINESSDYPFDGAPLSTQKYKHYNLLMYPLPGFYELYENIKQTYKELSKSNKPAYIQCWLNVYKQGEYLGWHTHEPMTGSEPGWHGFYCVNVQPDSYTEYIIGDNSNTITIPSVDNLLVIGKTDFDQHRTSIGTDDTNPRVTIAFDITPAYALTPFYDMDIKPDLNRWIPI